MIRTGGLVAAALVRGCEASGGGNDTEPEPERLSEDERRKWMASGRVRR